MSRYAPMLLTLAAIWGASYLFIKVAVDDGIEPAPLMAVRLLGAAALLAVYLVWRLGEAGWRCRYEPAGEVFHEPRPDWSAWVRQRIDYGSSAAPLAHRHPGALAPIRMSGWSVATWVLAAVGRPLMGSVVGAGSAAALIRKLPEVPPRAPTAKH